VREQVLQYIRDRKLLKPGARVAVAVSGGADSVALLRGLLDLRSDLGIVLFVAHFNHQLRGEDSDADEHFVAELARHHELPFFSGRGDVREHALTGKLSLEHAARELRYQWLIETARQQRLDSVATAHTVDDQAETVLMKFLRGASTRGLAGIHPVLVRDSVRIVRPLLDTKRADIEQYLASIAQPWREDHTNSDTRYTRNRIRHELLPLLERDYNPSLRGQLSLTADIAAEEEAAWDEMAATYVRQWQMDEGLMLIKDRPLCFRRDFADESIALQRRALKCFLEQHGITVDFQHVESVRACALGGPAVVNLPGDWRARRDTHWLALIPPSATAGEEDAVRSYEYFLQLTGYCTVAEAGIDLHARIVSEKLAAREAPGSLLRLVGVGSRFLVRNWLPGDRFRPAHSASEEKLKRLFADKRIPADQRPLWPVLLSGARIVWVREFPVAHDFAWVPGDGDAIKIEVLPFEPTPTAT
jgi:tRNA(Ile)-lysidine synthase